MNYFLVFITFFLAISCQESLKMTAMAQRGNCPYQTSKYIVQSASYDEATGIYDIFLLDGPPCLRGHFQTQNLRLQRLQEESKEKAFLQFVEGEDPVLQMVEDYQIKMMTTVNDGNQMVKKETSSWSPFMSSMAGAAIGSMAGNALSNAFIKPRYYAPPPVNEGQSGILRGFGGDGDTKDKAYSSYQRKYGKMPSSYSSYQRNQRTPMPSQGFNGLQRRQKLHRNSDYFAKRGQRGFFRGGGRRR